MAMKTVGEIERELRWVSAEELRKLEAALSTRRGEPGNRMRQQVVGLLVRREVARRAEAKLAERGRG
jgi:hypothetical protein